VIVLTRRGSCLTRARFSANILTTQVELHWWLRTRTLISRM